MFRPDSPKLPLAGGTRLSKKAVRYGAHHLDPSRDDIQDVATLATPLLARAAVAERVLPIPSTPGTPFPPELRLAMTSSLYELHSHRSLNSPVLLLATESWVDAGLGAQAAIAHVLDTIPTDVLATFNADQLIDFRSRRPIVRISDGVLDSMSWPMIQLRAGRDAAGTDVLVLVGPEPDMAWHAFVRGVVDLTTQLGVRLVVSLGAYAAPVPHTRPVSLMAIATKAELAAQVGVVPGSADMPAGIQTALQEGFAAAGIPAIGIWARVPHYLAAVPYPAASAALVEALATVAGLQVSAGELHTAAQSVSSQINEIVANSEEYSTLVRRLEEAFDGALRTPPDFSGLPTGDELAAEVERFLRGEQGEQGGQAGQGEQGGQ